MEREGGIIGTEWIFSLAMIFFIFTMILLIFLVNSKHTSVSSESMFFPESTGSDLLFPNHFLSDLSVSRSNVGICFVSQMVITFYAQGLWEIS